MATARTWAPLRMMTSAIAESTGKVEMHVAEDLAGINAHANWNLRKYNALGWRWQEVKSKIKVSCQNNIQDALWKTSMFSWLTGWSGAMSRCWRDPASLMFTYVAYIFLKRFGVATIPDACLMWLQFRSRSRSMVIRKGLYPSLWGL